MKRLIVSIALGLFMAAQSIVPAFAQMHGDQKPNDSVPFDTAYGSNVLPPDQQPSEDGAAGTPAAGVPGAFTEMPGASTTEGIPYGEDGLSGPNYTCTTWFSAEECALMDREHQEKLADKLTDLRSSDPDAYNKKLKEMERGFALRLRERERFENRAEKKVAIGMPQEQLIEYREKFEKRFDEKMNKQMGKFFEERMERTESGENGESAPNYTCTTWFSAEECALMDREHQEKLADKLTDLRSSDPDAYNKKLKEMERGFALRLRERERFENRAEKIAVGMTPEQFTKYRERFERRFQEKMGKQTRKLFEKRMERTKRTISAALPDLVISDVSIEYVILPNGQSGYIANFTILNRDYSASANESSLRVSAENSASITRTNTFAVIPPLGPRESYSYTTPGAITWLISDLGDSVRIRSTIDSENIVIESDEENNLEIRIFPPASN